MIIGIGTDIIEIKRIEEAVNRTPKFLEKMFTEKEIALFKSKAMKMETIAGNFAAKEALSKALGTGFRGYSFKDFEVLRNELGKPIIEPCEKVKDNIGKEDIKINVSISHNRSDAIAFVVVEA